ncbi:TPA: hypothetical protein ACF1UP_002860, partial [Enterococcus hirae]
SQFLLGERSGQDTLFTTSRETQKTLGVRLFVPIDLLAINSSSLCSKKQKPFSVLCTNCLTITH